MFIFSNKMYGSDFMEQPTCLFSVAAQPVVNGDAMPDTRMSTKHAARIGDHHNHHRDQHHHHHPHLQQQQQQQLPGSQQRVM